MPMTVTCWHTQLSMHRSSWIDHQYHVRHLDCPFDLTNQMYQESRRIQYIEPSIYADSNRLVIVDNFVYRGSTRNCHCFPNDEIVLPIKKASDAFVTLKLRVWSQKCIKSRQKMKYILPALFLLYYIHVRYSTKGQFIFCGNTSTQAQNSTINNLW